MRKFAIVFAGFLLTTLGMSRTSSATTTTRLWRFHGTTCLPTNGSQTLIDYNQYGIFNISATTATIFCPLPLNNATNANESMTNMLAVIVYNRSNTTPLTCVLQQTDTAGNLLFSQSMSAGAAGPGSAPQQLLFNPSGAGPGSAVTGPWFLNCTLPAVQSGWNSVLSAISVTTSF